MFFKISEITLVPIHIPGNKSPTQYLIHWFIKRWKYIPQLSSIQPWSRLNHRYSKCFKWFLLIIRFVLNVDNGGFVYHRLESYSFGIPFISASFTSLLKHKWTTLYTYRSFYYQSFIALHPFACLLLFWLDFFFVSRLPVLSTPLSFLFYTWFE